MDNSVLRLLLVLPLAALSAGACGGNAFQAGGSGGSGPAGSGPGGGVGSAGAPSGGALGVSGSVGTAGSVNSAGAGNASSGGSSSGGSSSGGSNSGGSAGSDFRACSSNTDCTVVPVSCCSCGLGSVSSFTAINQVYTEQYSQRCEVADMACGACPPLVPGFDNPVNYYVATCDAGRCQVVDLQATPATDCVSDQDCMLRAGTACCAGCSGSDIALNNQAEPELEALVCGVTVGACSACAPPASESGPACVANKCHVRAQPCTQAQPCAG